MSNEQVFNSGKAVGKPEEKVEDLSASIYIDTSDAVESTQQKGAEAISQASDAVDSVKSKASDAMVSVKTKASKK